jgi:DNA-directed RNA polymerase specialized sigma24 family protein
VSPGLCDQAGHPLPPLEDVLQHAQQPDAGQPLANLLGEFTVHRIQRAFAGLDPEQRVAFRALLRDLGERSAVIISAHLVERGCRRRVR